MKRKETVKLKKGEIYSGYLKNGKPHGKGTITKEGWLSPYITGTFKNGALVKGRFDGMGMIVEGKFDKNLNCKGKIIYKIGNKKPTSEYMGEIKISKKWGYEPYGKGKLINKWNGVKSIGFFKKGLLIKGKVYDPKKKKWEVVG